MRARPSAQPLDRTFTVNCHGSVTATTRRVKVDCSAWRGHALAIATMYSTIAPLALLRVAFCLIHGGPIKCLHVCACEHAHPRSRLIELLRLINF